MVRLRNSDLLQHRVENAAVVDEDGDILGAESHLLHDIDEQHQDFCFGNFFGLSDDVRVPLEMLAPPTLRHTFVAEALRN